MSAIRWETWSAADVSPAERTKWAERIAAGETISVQSGDSMVFSEQGREPDELLIADVRVRREARVPLPARWVDDKAVRRALADALLEMVELLRMPSVHVECDNALTAERLVSVGREATAALQKAGRIP